MLEELNSQPHNSRISNILNLVIDDFYSIEEPWYLTFLHYKHIINQTHKSDPSPRALKDNQSFPLPHFCNRHSGKRTHTSHLLRDTNNIFWDNDFCDSYIHLKDWWFPGRERRDCHNRNNYIPNHRTVRPWSTHNNSYCTCFSNSYTSSLQFLQESAR